MLTTFIRIHWNRHETSFPNHIANFWCPKNNPNSTKTRTVEIELGCMIIPSYSDDRFPKWRTRPVIEISPTKAGGTLAALFAKQLGGRHRGCVRYCERSVVCLRMKQSRVFWRSRMRERGKGCPYVAQSLGTKGMSEVRAKPGSGEPGEDEERRKQRRSTKAPFEANWLGDEFKCRARQGDKGGCRGSCRLVQLAQSRPARKRSTPDGGPAGARGGQKSRTDGSASLEMVKVY